MRAGRIALVLVAVALVAGVALAATGKLAWVRGVTQRELTAVASAWTAPSAQDAGGVVDAGAAVDAAVKVQAAPLSSAQLSAPLYHVTFPAECGAPPEMKIVIKASVNLGHAVAVQATTDPPDPRIEGCIEDATRRLQWPPSRKTQKVTVRY